MIDCLERGKTVTGVYYAELIRELRSAIKEKRREKLSHGVLLHQDNAPAHTSAVTMAAIRECGFKLLSQPPYSPDLAPSDYHVFRSLKDSLRGQSFGCDEEVIHTINDLFELQVKQFFVAGVNSLAHRWESVLCLKWIILKNCKVNLTLVISVSDFLITYWSTLVCPPNAWSFRASGVNNFCFFLIFNKATAYTPQQTLTQNTSKAVDSGKEVHFECPENCIRYLVS